MRMRTSLIIAAVIIVGMFVFDRIMTAEMSRWADQVVAISLTQRLLAGVAFLWHRFWWIGAPGIAAVFLLISMVTDRSASGKTAG